MDFKQKLVKNFKKYGFELTDIQIDKFQKYYELLVCENEKYNLTAITDEDEVILKHFIDSVLPILEFKNEDKILDIGSGAGFPAIPLAIMNNTLKITAIDAVNKKINFINMVASSLCLDNLKAIHYRAEEYVKNNRNTFDKVTSRAVAHLSTISEYSLPFVKIGGEMIAYKGLNVDNELQESKNAIKILGGTVKDVKRYNLSEMERFIVVVEKIKETPAKYPRSQNKPRTNPLK